VRLAQELTHDVKVQYLETSKYTELPPCPYCGEKHVQLCEFNLPTWGTTDATYQCSACYRRWVITYEQDWWESDSEAG
jgi:DNA-directed RNA polymerase subunit RPC12/RpoP